MNVGGTTSEYASISSDKASEKLARRKPKVSWERVILPGLVGPKARPKGVVDGQQVNIPVPDSGVMQGWRRVAKPVIGFWYKHVGRPFWQIRKVNSEVLRGERKL